MWSATPKHRNTVSELTSDLCAYVPANFVVEAHGMVVRWSSGLAQDAQRTPSRRGLAWMIRSPYFPALSGDVDGR